MADKYSPDYYDASSALEDAVFYSFEDGRAHLEESPRFPFETLVPASYDADRRTAPLPDFEVTVNDSFSENSWNGPFARVFRDADRRNKLEEYRWKIQNECCTML